MKSIISFVIFCACFINCNRCATIPNQQQRDERVCIQRMKQHIQLEIDTFLSLMAMAQHFTQTSVNRYGFGKLFLDAAVEQREHATKLAEYLMVHMKIDDLGNLVTINEPAKQKWTNGIDALSDAVTIEKLSQTSGQEIVDKCHGYPFIVDYVNGTVLHDLHKRQRDLAARLASLSEKILLNGDEAESDFDKILILEQYIFAHNKV